MYLRQHILYSNESKMAEKWQHGLAEMGQLAAPKTKKKNNNQFIFIWSVIRGMSQKALSNLQLRSLLLFNKICMVILLGLFKKKKVSEHPILHLKMLENASQSMLWRALQLLLSKVVKTLLKKFEVNCETFRWVIFWFSCFGRNIICSPCKRMN